MIISLWGFESHSIISMQRIHRKQGTTINFFLQSDSNQHLKYKRKTTTPFHKITSIHIYPALTTSRKFQVPQQELFPSIMSSAR